MRATCLTNRSALFQSSLGSVDDLWHRRLDCFYQIFEKLRSKLDRLVKNYQNFDVKTFKKKHIQQPALSLSLSLSLSLTLSLAVLKSLSFLNNKVHQNCLYEVEQSVDHENLKWSIL